MNVFNRVVENIKILQQDIDMVNLNEKDLYEIKQSLDVQKEVYRFCKPWFNSDRKTFVLSKTLLESFNNTDVPFCEAPKNFVYPFKTFMIECDIPMFYDVFNKPVFNLCCYTKDYNFGDNNYDSCFDEKKLSIFGFSLTKNGLIGYSVATFGYEYSLETSLNIAKSSINKYGGFKDSITLSDNIIQKIINIFFNTIMYVDDPHRNIEETEVHKEMKLKNKKDNSLKYHQSFIYLTTRKGYTSLSTDSSGKKIEARFIVRGHWKNQACGEKHSSHKRIRIEPYYKGPEFGKEINKPYLLK